MIITDITKDAPSGSFRWSGSKPANLMPVCFHIQCIGLVTIVIGIWKKNKRKVIASQRRKGLSQPVLELNGSLLPWRISPAIHHPVKKSHMTRWKKILYLL